MPRVSRAHSGVRPIRISFLIEYHCILEFGIEEIILEVATALHNVKRYGPYQVLISIFTSKIGSLEKIGADRQQYQAEFLWLEHELPVKQEEQQEALHKVLSNFDKQLDHMESTQKEDVLVASISVPEVSGRDLVCNQTHLEYSNMYPRAAIVE